MRRRKFITLVGGAVATWPLAAQAQIVGFFGSDGTTIPDANTVLRRLLGFDLFETPASLPEDLGFTQ